MPNRVRLIRSRSYHLINLFKLVPLFLFQSHEQFTSNQCCGFKHFTALKHSTALFISRTLLSPFNSLRDSNRCRITNSNEFNHRMHRQKGNEYNTPISFMSIFTWLTTKKIEIIAGHNLEIKFKLYSIEH